MKLEKFTKVCIEDLFKIGVYKITCISNGKIYIGSATATKGHSKSHKGFYGRWKDHINRLLNNKHRNKHLQGAWNLYGEDNFIFEIVEICKSEICEERETNWIDYYESCDQNKGFNFIRQPLRNINSKSESTRLKISKSLMGHKVSNDIITKLSKSVLQYDLNNNFIAEYKSMTDAQKITGIDRTSIQNVCKGKYKSSSNFIWKYKNPNDLQYKKSNILSNIILKNIKTNEILIFKSINKCAEYIKYNRCTIRGYINSDRLLEDKYLITKNN